MLVSSAIIGWMTQLLRMIWWKPITPSSGASGLRCSLSSCHGVYQIGELQARS